MTSGGDAVHHPSSRPAVRPSDLRLLQRQPPMTARAVHPRGGSGTGRGRRTAVRCRRTGSGLRRRGRSRLWPSRMPPSTTASSRPPGTSTKWTMGMGSAMSGHGDEGPEHHRRPLEPVGQRELGDLRPGGAGRSAEPLQLGARWYRRSLGVERVLLQVVLLRPHRAGPVELLLVVVGIADEQMQRARPHGRLDLCAGRGVDRRG